MALTIEPVRTRSALTEFIVLPRRLYQGMSGYVAPLDYECRQLLDPRRSVFFSHGYASYWIARRDGRAVGRISAQIDLLADEKIGFFGCLDAVDDREVVAALMRTAEQWLRERGRRIARGPYLLSINGEPGLLLEGHMEPPVTLFSWHPAYLEPHLRAQGYTPAMRFLCHRLDYRAWEHQQLQKVGAMRPRTDLTIRSLRLDHLDEDAEIGRRIFNDGWQSNWGFIPASESEIRALTHNFRPFMSADSGFFIDVRGEPAAFVLSLPNISEITADLGPDPSLFGWIKFLFRIWKKKYRGFRIPLIGIASKYQTSILGARLTTTAFEELNRRMRARGAEELISGWVVEDNHAILRLIESFGFRKSRTYGVYEKNLIG